MIGPRHTFWSVAKRITDGLQDGSITLEAHSRPVHETGTIGRAISDLGRAALARQSEIGQSAFIMAVFAISFLVMYFFGFVGMVCLLVVVAVIVGGAKSDNLAFSILVVTVIVAVLAGILASPRFKTPATSKTQPTIKI